MVKGESRDTCNVGHKTQTNLTFLLTISRLCYDYQIIMQQYLDKYNDTTGIGMGIKRVNGVSLAVRKLRPSLLGILQICSPNTNKQYFITLEFKPMNYQGSRNCYPFIGRLLCLQCRRITLVSGRWFHFSYSMMHIIINYN
jgi:hypothetical protein